MQFYPLRLIRKIPNTSLAHDFYFEIPKEYRHLFHYKPGQYLTFRFVVDGKEYRRSYSFMTSPYTDEMPGVTVKRIGDGKISNYVNEHAAVGDIWEALPPMGNFVIEPQSDRTATYVMIGAGSGITPLMSMIKSILHVELKSQIWLLYGNRHESHILFHSILDRLEREHPQRFQVIHSLSRPSEQWTGRRGRLSREAIRSILLEGIPYGSAFGFYLCGPAGLIQEAEIALAGLGVDPQKIHKEFFSAPASIEEPTVPTTSEASFEVSEVTIWLDDEQHHIQVRADEYILDAALDSGIEPPYACRMGICTTCRARLLEGQVHMDEDEGLSSQDIENGFILTCQAKPLTSVVRIKYE